MEELSQNNNAVSESSSQTMNEQLLDEFHRLKALIKAKGIFVGKDERSKAQKQELSNNKAKGNNHVVQRSKQTVNGEPDQCRGKVINSNSCCESESTIYK